MLSCQSNPEKPYTEKKTKHTPSGYSLFANCSFDATKNKLDWNRGKDLWKEHAMKIINYEEKEMIPVTNEGNEYYEMQKVCHIRKKQKNLVLIKMMKIYLNYIIQ